MGYLRWRSLLLGLFFLTLAKSPVLGASVEQWGRFEAIFTNNRSYADPYRNVRLNVSYTRPDATAVNFWGFYDESNVWKIRFMPDQIGHWTYNASFSDGAPGGTGSFECVPGAIPGMIGRDESNPLWFGFKGGGHIQLRSFHVGDRFFARNWNATNRTAFVDWAQAQGYNMLSIASHYLNRATSGRGLGWNTPDLWDGPKRTLVPSEYRYLESLVDDLAARKIVAFPFAGFFGKSSDFPIDHADQELYVRYTLARLGPYWNLVLAVAGPEPLLSSDTAEYQNAMGLTDIGRLGAVVQTSDVFHHLISNHNVTGENAFDDEPWEGYTTLQGPKTVNRQTLGSGLLAFHGPKPLYAAEVLWPGNTLGHPTYTDTDIRKNGFVIIMSAATINFGDMEGTSSSGFSGSMDFADKIQSRHDIIKQVWDFFETQRFYRMKPSPNLVNNGWCLADPGREYLVYLQSRGSVSVTLSNAPYQVEWINAQDISDKRIGTATTNGLNLTSPTTGDDWMLHLYKPIEVWRETWFSNEVDNASVSSDAADPDLDGLSNLGEFLYGLNPTLSDTQSGHLPVLTRTNGNWIVHFICRAQAETWPTRWLYEFSTDLMSWTEGVPGIDYSDLAVVPNGDGTETVMFRVLSNAAFRFVRVTNGLLTN